MSSGPMDLYLSFNQIGILEWGTDCLGWHKYVKLRWKEGYVLIIITPLGINQTTKLVINYVGKITGLEITVSTLK